MDNNQAIVQVFQNDYIMEYILKMLDLRQQYEVQKICQRLRFLMITLVWKCLCKEMQMNRNKMGRFTDEEYFEMLHLNSDNIQKLTIVAEDGASLPKYFPARYDNLLELKIKWRSLSEDDVILTLVSNCPNLQLLDYNEDRHESRQPEKELQTFEDLWPLIHLRVLIWRNSVKTISYKDLYLLATKVPLEHLELYNVQIAQAEFDFERFSLDKTPRLKVFIDCPGNCPPNLANESFLLQFRDLEKIKLSGCNALSTISWLLSKNNLKYLELVDGDYANSNFNITADASTICSSLQNLKIVGKSSNSSVFWLTFLQLPSTNLESLQELTFTKQNVTDEYIRAISEKACPHLKILHLDECKISGRYINLLTSLQSLTIINNNLNMSWSNLYDILRDLKDLKYLEIDCMLLNRDVSDIPKNIQYLANSLEIIKIYRTEIMENFWEYITENCEDSFNNVHSLHFNHYELGTYFGYSFFEEFPRLQTLQIERKAFMAEDMIPTAKHLIYIDCTHMKWSDVVDILKCTRVEILEFFNMTVDFDDDAVGPLDKDQKILKHIRSVIVPYCFFNDSYKFWLRCLVECPKFLLCCMGHSSHNDVLERIFMEPRAGERIIGIHANKDLGVIKKYCAKNVSRKIPVYLLDACTRLWNPRFDDENHSLVIIIEI